MRKGAQTKVKRKSIITYIIPLLIVVVIVGIIGLNITKENNIKNISNKNKIASGYMSEEIQKLIESDDENLISTKYLITDNTIERVRENTSIDEFKKEFKREVKVYNNETLDEEITEGIIKTGMIIEDKDDIYTVIVDGDVSKDGKINQLDISKMIRNEIEDLSSQKASEIGVDKITEKIVFGKFDIEKVREVTKPEIEIISGEIGQNDWYVSDVEIGIKQKDEKGTKTVYKIKGTEQKEITQITDDEKITLSKDGVYKIIAYTYGEEGNKSQVEEKIIKINKTGIEAIIDYTPDTETTDPVIATVTFNKEGITITNNEGKNTYEFTENGEFTFTYEDEMGRTGTITAKVDWIKQKEIIGQDGEWKYFVNKDNTIQLTQYLGNKTEVTVPSNYDGYEVYAVGNQYAKETPKMCYNVFGEKTTSNKTITKITIEDGIKEIKTGAFISCKGLTGNLVIPNSVTSIGYGAFVNCTGLNGTLTLSDNLINIGDYAFNRCSGLNGTLTLPKNLTNIGDYAFNYCSGLTGDLVIPDSVTEIGRTAFQYCSGLNGTLTLPKNLTNIGDYAFNYCSGLTGDLVIPDSVTEIGRTAFQYCSGFNGTLTLPKNLTNIKDWTFNQCSGLTGNLVIPNSVTEIGKAAFQYCSGLNGTLTLPKNLTNIGDGAFNKCSGLTGDLVIPDSVTEIGRIVFQSCSGFNGTLTLPKNLTNIGDYAFNQCSGLTGDLVIPDSVTDIGSVAFQCLYNMKGKLKLSNNVKNIGAWAFYDDKFTGALELPEGLETLGEAAFGKNTNFENVTIKIPSTLKKIGKDCEFNGENLGLSTHDFYNFGANVKKFEAFEVAEGNENFVAIDGVLYTKNKKRLISYPRDKKDTTYEILEGVVTIDELSISSNMTLQTLIIPDSLSMDIRSQFIRIKNTHVLTASLYSYTSIQNIVAKDTNPNYTSVDGVLYTKDLKEMVYVSSGRTNEVIIPDEVETIRDKAIYYSQVARRISKMYIPSNVVNISDSTISSLNSFVNIVEVSEDNPIFTVDSNNKLIKK